MYKERFKEVLKYSAIGYGIGFVLSIVLVIALGASGVWDFVGGILAVTLVLGSIISIIICTKSGTKGFMNTAIEHLWGSIKSIFFGSILGGGTFFFILGIVKFVIGIMIMIPVGLYMAVSYLLNLIYLGIMSSLESRNKLEAKEELCNTLDKTVTVVSIILTIVLCFLLYRALFVKDSTPAVQPEKPQATVEEAKTNETTEKIPEKTDEPTQPTVEEAPVEPVEEAVPDSYEIKVSDIDSDFIKALNDKTKNPVTERVESGVTLSGRYCNITERDLLWKIAGHVTGEPELAKLQIGSNAEGNRMFAIYKVPYEVVVEDNNDSNRVANGDILGKGDVFVACMIDKSILHSDGSVTIGEVGKREIELSMDDLDRFVDDYKDSYNYEEYAGDSLSNSANSSDEDSVVSHSEEIVYILDSHELSTESYEGAFGRRSDDYVKIYLKDTNLVDNYDQHFYNYMDHETFKFTEYKDFADYEKNVTDYDYWKNMDGVSYEITSSPDIEDFFAGVDGADHETVKNETITNKDGDDIQTYLVRLYMGEETTGTEYFYYKPIKDTDLYLRIDIFEEDVVPDEITPIDKYLDITCDDYYVFDYNE